MRIKYIRLKNFAGVFTAMKLKDLIIDFEKGNRNTPINILLGPNGSGKTTLLSMLQPFANVGTLDIKNATNLILENQDGYKEIHLEEEGVEYIIKHYYYNTKTTKSIKSFISKDGEELNKNGNVTSFKELVFSELGLEQDYLKLLRLGPNVTNFIDMKASERKAFITDLLNDVDVYSSIYRKISDKTKIHGALIKSCSDRLHKLNISDETVAIEELDRLNKMIDSLRDRTTSLSMNIGNKMSDIKNLMGNLDENTIMFKVAELKQNIESLNKKLRSMESIIERSGGAINVDTSSYNDVVENIMNITNQLEVKQSEFNISMRSLDDLYRSLMDKKIQLANCKSRENIKTMKQSIHKINERIKDYDNRIKTLDTNITKQDITSALSLFQYIDKLILDICAFDNLVVREVIGMIGRGENVEFHATKKIKKISDKIDYMKIELQKQNNGIDISKSFVACKPCNCTEDNCPFEKFYKVVMGTQKNKSVLDDIFKLEQQQDTFATYYTINSLYNTISKIVMTNKTNIDKLPSQMVDLKGIMKSILTGGDEKFYNEEGLTALITLLEDKIDYDKDIEMIDELNAQIKANETNIKLEDLINKEYENIEANIAVMTSKSLSMSNDLKILEKNLDLTKRAEELIRTVLFEYNDTEKEKDTALDELNNYMEIISKTKEAYKEIDVLKQELDRVNHMYKLSETERMNRVNSLDNYRNLKDELEVLEKTYDDLKIIREAVSSTKGIPLLFIQLYLKNTKNRVNELLAKVFGEELQIDDFVINDKEFKIPFIKNGIKVEDISFASQGEGSFISMAISFALIDQSLDKYNILLLDEIDATLDTKNRANFIKILEEQLKSIGAEQVFMITHNNMFDAYPVNVIMTAPCTIDHLNNVTLIN